MSLESALAQRVGAGRVVAAAGCTDVLSTTACTAVDAAPVHAAIAEAEVHDTVWGAVMLILMRSRSDPAEIPLGFYNSAMPSSYRGGVCWPGFDCVTRVSISRWPTTLRGGGACMRRC